MPVPKSWHPGEIAAQQARGFEDAVWGAHSSSMEAGLPSNMGAFLEALPFLPVTTLDDDGRPWGSILALHGELGFIKVLDDERVRVKARLPPGTPARSAVLRSAAGGQALIAGVGIMFHNRRRNKYEGRIVDVGSTEPADNVFEFTIEMSTSMGNCPKYINMRLLIPTQPGASKAALSPSSTNATGPLPDALIAEIGHAELAYLHTRHTGGEGSSWSPDPDRLGCNIRGGPRGFLRTYYDEEKGRTAIVLPDFSGNRFLQSYGNVARDPVAALTIPIWALHTAAKPSSRSTVLHITGEAEVLAGDAVRPLIRGVAGALRIWVDGWAHTDNLPLLVDGRNAESQAVAAGMDLDDVDPELLFNASIGWSPYNPPVRLLNSERSASLPVSTAGQGPKAELVRAKMWSPDLATITWRVDAEAAKAWRPGRHLIVDATETLDARVTMYSHMSFYRGREKDLNDDGVRSWTISAARSAADGSLAELDVTLRRVPRGGVTPDLFRHAAALEKAQQEVGSATPQAMALPLFGIEGDVLLPDIAEGGTLRGAYLVAGIGLTPFLAHLSGLSDRLHGADLVVLMASRAVEASTLLGIVREALGEGRADETSKSRSSPLSITIHLLASSTLDGAEDIAGLSRSREAGRVGFADRLEIVVHKDKRLSPASVSASSHRHPVEFHLDSEAHAASLELLKTCEYAVVCGPAPFDAIAKAALRNAGVDAAKIHSESFSF